MVARIGEYTMKKLEGILEELKDVEIDEKSFSSFQINQLLAKEIIQQRLDIPASEQNVVQLALYITELEDDYYTEMKLQETPHLY